MFALISASVFTTIFLLCQKGFGWPPNHPPPSSPQNLPMLQSCSASLEKILFLFVFQRPADNSEEEDEDVSLDLIIDHIFCEDPGL